MKELLKLRIVVRIFDSEPYSDEERWFMYKINQGHLTVFCIVFVWLGGPPSPVRIMTQVPWFMYQNRLGPFGGIYYPNFVPCFVVLHLNGLLCYWHIIRKAVWFVMNFLISKYNVIFIYFSSSCLCPDSCLRLRLRLSVLYVEKKLLQNISKFEILSHVCYDMPATLNQQKNSSI